MNLDIGSIVLLMDNEYTVHKVIITECDIVFKSGNVKKNFKYRGYHYPFGFMGVDSIVHFDDKDIYKVIYNSNIDKESNETIEVSTKIKYNNENYLVIGKDVTTVGKPVDGINVFACISVDNPNSYEVKYIPSNKEIDVVNYGYSNDEYIELNNNRHNRIDYSLKTYNRLLPIGSVIEVEMEDIGYVDMVIVAKNLKRDDQTYDYASVIAGIGFIEPKKIQLINKDEVNKIKHVGYFNKEESDYTFEILIDKGLLQRG